MKLLFIDKAILVATLLILIFSGTFITYEIVLNEKCHKIWKIIFLSAFIVAIKYYFWKVRY